MRTGDTTYKQYRVYGKRQDSYDCFWPFKSKYQKQQEALNLEKLTASLNLTHKQNAIARAKAKTESLKAQAEQLKAIAAQKAAEKADTQLKGAKVVTQLKYVSLGIGIIVLVGGIALIGYLVNQRKSAKKLEIK